MNNIINIEVEKGELKVYPEKGIIHHKVPKSMTDDEFQLLLKQGLEPFIQYKCHKWLSDDRDMSFDPNKRPKRDRFSWEEKITKFGWKAWAIVLKNDSDIIKIAESQISRNRELGIRVELFTDLDEALKWLEKQ